MPREDVPPEDKPGNAGAAVGSPPDLVGIVGENLRRLRTRRGLSLERLAKASGVSRAMLGQIELGRSAPTINVLWKIARSLDLPFAALISETPVTGSTVAMRRADAKILYRKTADFHQGPCFPFDSQRKVEFYELRLAPLGLAESEAHALGTTETLVVNRGQLDVEINGRTHHLDVGDALALRGRYPPCLSQSRS